MNVVALDTNVLLRLVHSADTSARVCSPELPRTRREIVEFVQRGAKRAEYGEQVLEVLGARRFGTCPVPNLRTL